jgi:5-methylcytosine-specific restriction endonuclease McrA
MKIKFTLTPINFGVGARLEVDHKIPVAKGGRNEIENLWALCFECNRGKGVQEV